MKNLSKNIALSLVIVFAGLSLSACTKDTETTLQETDTQQIEMVQLPTRPAEVNGVVRSIEGNEVIVAREIKEALSEEDQAAKKAERASMTQEEKQALRKEELGATETESLTIIIPVGVPIQMSSGTGDGSSVNADLADIKSGSYVSIWMNNDEAEAVKLKGTN